MAKICNIFRDFSSEFRIKIETLSFNLEQKDFFIENFSSWNEVEDYFYIIEDDTLKFDIATVKNIFIEKYPETKDKILKTKETDLFLFMKEFGVKEFFKTSDILFIKKEAR